MDETKPGVGGARPPMPTRQDALAPLSPFLRAERVLRRQERIRAQIERDKAGEHTIPTWVLVVILVVLVGGFVAFVAFS